MSRLFLAPRARRALGRLLRRLRGVEIRRVRLVPDRAPVGRVLLSYIIDPFLVRGERAISLAHTQDWECWRMAHTWRELGFAVDVIHWTNARFAPDSPYDVLIDPRHNLERLSPLVGAECLKVFHAETAHWRTSDDAQRRRLDELAARRGVRLRQLRLVGENRGIETADCAVVLGNEWTLATYRPFGKPLFRVPLSNACLYPSPEGKDFERCRRRFVWFGAPHFVHKGLDRTLEAFAGAPELELSVAGPIDRDAEFANAYARELFATPNIATLGWLDVASERFRALAAGNAGAVFPSCSEGGGGSAVTTMHAGLVPVVTPEASVDVDPSCGVLLPDADVETIRAAARALAIRPAAELRALAVAAWRRARAGHTRESFARDYRAAVLQILETLRPRLRERVAA
jgi:glycosyltransferase involved in cell wall biosynthesis